ncbi:dynein regulatory complex protein 11-like [Daktulosphaira vitifoliae]|uniref:dynein regulatory complex protein 11-like n=1 Tax=Daktulosphaira vitifoliae TaxID=58002 RepID=UPI0021AA07E3|nr:dynein regulatory complex protein 11-like [Daktulosphaira vitifoliae]
MCTVKSLFKNVKEGSLNLEYEKVFNQSVNSILQEQNDRQNNIGCSIKTCDAKKTVEIYSTRIEPVVTITQFNTQKDSLGTTEHSIIQLETKTNKVKNEIIETNDAIIQIEQEDNCEHAVKDSTIKTFNNLMTDLNVVTNAVPHLDEPTKHIRKNIISSEVECRRNIEEKKAKRIITTADLNYPTQEEFNSRVVKYLPTNTRREEMNYIGNFRWKQAVEKLIDIQKEDQIFVVGGLYTDKTEARDIISGLYVRYTLISNELTAYHDSIIQPQIRILIKKLLIPLFGRLMELKQILMDGDLSIYTPVIETLNKMKVQYSSFELILPKYFQNDRRLFLNEINSKIDKIYNKMEQENEIDILSEVDENEKTEESSIIYLKREESSVSEFDVTTFKSMEEMTPARFQKVTEEDLERTQALLFIQKHIRASRDRIYANELLFQQRSRQRILSGQYIPPKKEQAHKYAIKIQRFWRGFRLKRKLKPQVIGIKIRRKHKPSGIQKLVDLKDLKLEKDTFRSLQMQSANKFWKAIERAQNNLNIYNKDDIMDEIKDELRNYIWNYFEYCTHLPTWPDLTPTIFDNDDILGLPPIVLTDGVLKSLKIPKIQYSSALNQRIPLGGSAVFHTGRWMTIEMGKILATIIVNLEEKTPKEKIKLIKEKAKRQNIEKNKFIAQQKNEEKLRQEKRTLGIVPEPSEFKEMFKEVFDEYVGNWKLFEGKLDRGYREDLITDDVYANAKVHLRAEVDGTIVNELENLKALFARDRGATLR